MLVPLCISKFSEIFLSFNSESLNRQKKMEVVVCLERIQVFQIRVCSVSNSCQVLTSTCALFVVEGVFVRRYFGNGETTKEVRPSTGILGKAFLSMSLQVTI